MGDFDRENLRTDNIKRTMVEVKDENTGEIFNLHPTSTPWSDKDFHKVFVKNLRKTLKGIKSKELKVILWLIEHMAPTNKITETYDDIAEKTGVSLSTVIRTVTSLEKYDFLCKSGKIFIVNPDVIFRGRYSNREIALDIYRKAKDANKEAARTLRNAEAFEKAKKDLELVQTTIKLSKQKEKLLKARIKKYSKEQEEPLPHGTQKASDEIRLEMLRQEIEELMDEADALEEEIEDRKEAQLNRKTESSADTGQTSDQKS